MTATAVLAHYNHIPYSPRLDMSLHNIKVKSEGRRGALLITSCYYFYRYSSLQAGISMKENNAYLQFMKS